MVNRADRRSWIFIGSIGMLALGSTAQAATPDYGFEVYGFGQADYIQDFKRVDPAWDDTLRPSRIPTTSGQFGSNGQSIISPRQSRLGARTLLPVEGQDFSAKFEFDLFGVGTEQ